MNDNISVCKFIRGFPREEEITHGRGPTFYYLSREQVKLGVNVHIICAKQRREKSYETNGINVHRVRTPYNLYSLKKFRQLNKKFKIDVVDIHGTSGIGYALFRRIIGRRPLVADVPHVRRGAKGIPFFYSPSNNLKNRFLTYVSLMRQKLLWKRADMLVAISEAVAKDLMEIYKITPDKIQVVHRGVAPEIFNLRQDTEDIARRLSVEGKKIVLYVGDFGLRRGLKYLIRSIPTVVERIPDTMFLLIGGTPKWLGTRIYWQMLREQIDELGVRDYVRLLDAIPHLELPKYYSLANIFVLPSLYEGLGKVLLEAMACERPVVATNVGGIPEIVTDGVDGLLVPPGRPDRIANAIIKLLSDPKKAKDMGVKGMHKVTTNLTWKQTAEETIGIYKQLIC